MAGLWFRLDDLRRGGLILLAAATAKVFLFDLARSTSPIASCRSSPRAAAPGERVAVAAPGTRTIRPAPPTVHDRRRASRPRARPNEPADRRHRLCTARAERHTRCMPLEEYRRKRDFAGHRTRRVRRRPPTLPSAAVGTSSSATVPRASITTSASRSRACSSRGPSAGPTLDPGVRRWPSTSRTTRSSTSTSRA
jgi:hypothetical protein